MNAKIVTDVLIKVAVLAVNVGGPMLNGWKQNKMIKESIAKEVAEQVEEALKNR